MTQDTIVIIILIIVVGYLIYSGIKSFRSKTGGKCSGCSGCSAKDEISMAIRQKKSC